MRRHVLLLGDLKGTQTLLQALDAASLETVEERIRHLQNSFALTFQEFCRASGSIFATTFSDSVLAEWKDYSEGLRYAGRFAVSLWRRAEPIQPLFRVFIDAGGAVSERDAIAAMLKLDGGRFVGLFSVSIAAWSVFMAERSHFPTGLFVGRELASSLEGVSLYAEDYNAGTFVYKQIRLDSTLTRAEAPTAMDR